MENAMQSSRPFLLLDPPSTTAFCRRGSLREKDTARNAPFPNIDLILLSGAVRQAGFQPAYIDAQLDRLSWAELLRQARELGVCGVVSLTSSSRVDDELAGLKGFKEGLGDVPCYVVGTIILQQDKLRLSRLMADNPWLDGIILNTAEHSLAELLKAPGDSAVEPLNIAIQRTTRSLMPDVTVRYGDSLRIPRPEHAIFRDRRYCFPQSKRAPVTCVQLSFGCPFSCEFCIDNQLYRKMLYRDIDDVVEELVEIDRLGFREVYFKDLTFGLHKALAVEFLEKLSAKRLKLRWLCTTRIDVAGREMLTLMKKAGCYGIEFGVEHSKEATRRRIDKRIADTRIHEVFADCRRLRIETTAFIMLAFEDDTEEDVRNTIRFARSLRPKYVSFNVVNALPGTAYEERARREGFLREGPSDFGFATSNIKHRYLTPQQVEALRREALRSFYFQPSMILEKLLDVRSFFELRKLIRLGLGVAS
jgi:anaerobic magnesium-protoporphyrin IX monomethyl ester cyclase